LWGAGTTPGWLRKVSAPFWGFDYLWYLFGVSCTYLASFCNLRDKSNETLHQLS